MADFKNHISRHLRSAKDWLNRAEDSFDKDRDIRGELDLLLAQAELQRVREVNRSTRWRYKYPLLTNCLAFSFAFIMVISGWYFWQDRQAEKTPPTVISQAEALRAPLPVKTAVLEVDIAPPQPVTVKPTAVPEPKPARPTAISAEAMDHTQPRPATAKVSDAASVPPGGEQDIKLSPEEMQKLIRAAGKSLRGQ